MTNLARAAVVAMVAYVANCGDRGYLAMLAQRRCVRAALATLDAFARRDALREPSMASRWKRMAARIRDASSHRDDTHPKHKTQIRERVPARGSRGLEQLPVEVLARVCTAGPLRLADVVALRHTSRRLCQFASGRAGIAVIREVCASVPDAVDPCTDRESVDNPAGSSDTDTTEPREPEDQGRSIDSLKRRRRRRSTNCNSVTTCGDGITWATGIAGAGRITLGVCAVHRGATGIAFPGDVRCSAAPREDQPAASPAWRDPHPGPLQPAPDQSPCGIAWWALRPADVGRAVCAAAAVPE
jgi:hypothetical protein